MAHPSPAKIAFTGSTEVGKIIMRSLAGADKKMTMELGGKAANIIFDDAPLDQAVEGVVNGIFFNQGHVCCAGSRLLVHEPVADAVVAKLRRRLARPAGGRPAGQEHRRRRDQFPGPARQDPRASREAGVARGRGDVTSRPAGSRPRASSSRRPSSPESRRATGSRGRRSSGRSLSHPHLPHGRRGGREGQQHRLRPERRRLDRQGLAHPEAVDRAQGGRRLGQHLQQVRPGLAVWRLQGVRLRPRGRPPGPPRLRPDV